MYRLTDAFPYLLTRVGVRMGELFSRRLEPYGLTLPMYRAMAALLEKGDRPLVELAEVTSIEVSTLSRQVAALARKGLVSRRRPDANGRMLAINLTDKGRQLLEKLIPLAVLHESVVLREFDQSRIAELKRDLVRIHHSLAELDVSSAPEARTVARPGASNKMRAPTPKNVTVRKLKQNKR